MDYDIVIIGGGPGGLTAGLYAARGDMKTLLLEKLLPGGQAATTYWIDNYPGFVEGVSGPQLMMSMKDQATRFGLEIKTDEVVGLEFLEDGFEVVGQEGKYTAHSVIISSGATVAQLGVPGEEKLRGKGVSYCATCDGAFFRNEELVVVGGGDAAVEEGMFLTKFAKKVYIVHRRDRLRAAKAIQERAFKNEKIDFIWDTVVEEILGDQDVEGVRLKNLKTGETRELACKGVFIYVGNVPNSQFLKGKIDMDERGYVLTNDQMETSRKGVFACGDVRKKILRQVVTACGEGATAAFAAQQFVEEKKGIAYK
ncbi:MAG: thioredoxin-disulfide reductase [Deltaproteobacteria bacterium]|nr:MAG: thioredoxin-disulfide reductase [Deltaproteobacteria bacterium]